VPTHTETIKIVKVSSSSGAASTTSFWQRRALDVVLLAAVVNVLWLWRNGDSTSYYNLYYAATVKSMLTSWHAFLFASFDPGGFVSIDKPPLGLWIQAFSAKILGFSPLSILLPEALAGILSVGLLYRLVSHTWGALAGTAAAFALTLTPICVATNRENGVDSLLILSVLLAAWAIESATETGRLRSLLACAVLVGIGFNIKGMQAYLIIPPFALLYLLGSPITWRARILHLLVAGSVTLAVSLAWVLAVDMIPSAQRPFVGSSSSNTEMSLAFGFNGFGRLADYPHYLLQYVGIGPGIPSPLRLLNRQLGGQIGWLLPLTIFGLLGVGSHTRLRLPLSKGERSLILWGSWFLTLAIFFSFTNFFHPYYLMILAPAAGALDGIGIVMLWRDYGCPGWRGWLLPLSITISAVVQAAILTAYPTWSPWLIPIIIGLCGIAAGILTLMRLITRFHSRTRTRITTAGGILALFIAPAIWASFPIWHYGNGDFPFAGPDLLHIAHPPIATDPATVSTMANYLINNRNGARYILATPSALIAAPLILQTDQPVMAYGGYIGADHILSVDRLSGLIRSNTMRFFLLHPLERGMQPSIGNWVVNHCMLVRRDLWQPYPDFGPNGPQLYDCSRVNDALTTKWVDGQNS